ncbi:MAG: hypothetical protein AB7P04_07255 [Bacteriovoracia bacterium]
MRALVIGILLSWNFGASVQADTSTVIDSCELDQAGYCGGRCTVTYRNTVPSGPTFELELKGHCRWDRYDCRCVPGEPEIEGPPFSRGGGKAGVAS